MKNAKIIVLGCAAFLVVLGLVLDIEALIGVPGAILLIYGAFVLRQRNKNKKAVTSSPLIHQAPQVPLPLHTPQAYAPVFSDKHIPRLEFVTVKGLYITPSDKEYDKGLSRIDNKIEKLGEMIGDACIFSYDNDPRKALKQKDKIEEYIQGIITFCEIEGQFMIDELNIRLDDINDYIQEFNDYMDNDYEREAAEYIAAQQQKQLEKKFLSDSKKTIIKTVIASDSGMTRKEICALFMPDRKNAIYRLLEELVYEGSLIEGKKGSNLHYTANK